MNILVFFLLNFFSFTADNIPWMQSKDSVGSIISTRHLNDIPCENVNMICVEYSQKESSKLLLKYVHWTFMQDSLILFTKTYSSDANQYGYRINWWSLVETYQAVIKHIVEVEGMVKIYDSVKVASRYSGCADFNGECGVELNGLSDNGIQVWSKFRKDSIVAFVMIVPGPIFQTCTEAYEDCNEYAVRHLSIVVEYHNLNFTERKLKEYNNGENQ